MTRDEAMSRLLGLIYFLQDENLLTQDEVNDINQAYNILIQQPDAETRLMLGIESPSQQLANFKKDERTAADALIAGAKAIN